MNDFWILAQSETGQVQKITSEQPTGGTEPITTQPGANGTGGEEQVPTQQRRGSPYSSLILIAAMFVLMYFVLFRGPRKKQQQQRQMIQELKKNDRVRTIGGIVGTIIDVKDDEITLKVDESNNTKIRIIPAAVSKKLTAES